MKITVYDKFIGKYKVLDSPAVPQPGCSVDSIGEYTPLPNVSNVIYFPTNNTLKSLGLPLTAYDSVALVILG